MSIARTVGLLLTCNKKRNSTQRVVGEFALGGLIVPFKVIVPVADGLGLTADVPGLGGLTPAGCLGAGSVEEGGSPLVPILMIRFTGS